MPLFASKSSFFSECNYFHISLMIKLHSSGPLGLLSSLDIFENKISLSHVLEGVSSVVC